MDENMNEIMKELGAHGSEIKRNTESIEKTDKKLDEFIETTNRKFASVDKKFGNFDIQFVELNNKIDNRMDGLGGKIDTFMKSMNDKFEQQTKSFLEIKSKVDKYEQEQQEDDKDTKKRWKDIKFGTIGKIVLGIASALGGALGAVLVSALVNSV